MACEMDVQRRVANRHMRGVRVYTGGKDKQCRKRGRDLFSRSKDVEENSSGVA